MWLTIRSGASRGTAVQVGDAQFILGRDEECDLTLPDGKVSRRHASLESLGDGRLRLKDLGSSNGTYVNGTRIDSTVLGDREQIQLGDTLLVTSRAEPALDRGATVIGTLAGRSSGVQRMLLQRSARRATIVASSALLAALTLGALFATGALSRSGDAGAAVERVVSEVAHGTVYVEAVRDGAPAESGTGWVLDGRQGLIVTNAHVINGGSTFRVGLGLLSQPAKLVAVAPCEDLAVLRVQNTAGLEPVPLGTQSSLRLGETVVAVGYPVNASEQAHLTSTTGVVAVVRSTYQERALDVPRYPNVVQTDAALNPGSSGGPLLDLGGKLVGVTSAARTTSSDGRIIQGQNYAIGVDRVKQVVSVLRRGRSLGWTWLGFEYATPAQLTRRRLPSGLLVAGAVPGTAADHAGLGRPGTVIVAVNGMPVTSLATYCDAVDGIGAGAPVALEVVEPGASAPKTVRLRLAD